MAEVKITLRDDPEDGSVHFLIDKGEVAPNKELTPAQHMAWIMLDSLNDDDNVEDLGGEK